MPSLNDLHCSIELADTYEKLREYGVCYSDGVVEAFIPIPLNTKPFTIHLTSTGYVAPGLAMFVYIDGVYQCNRNRQGLIIPDGTEPMTRTLVDFRVRQKEETRSDGRFMGREWNFEKLNVVSADEAPDIPPDVLHAVGSIEVIVLRCTGDIFTDGTLPRLSKPLPLLSKAPEPRNSAMAMKKAPRRASTPPPAQESDNEGSASGLFGVFDGAGDSPPGPPQFLDGYGDSSPGPPQFLNGFGDSPPGPPQFLDGYGTERRRSRHDHGGHRYGVSPTHSLRSPLDIPRNYRSDWPAERSSLENRIETLLTSLRSGSDPPEDRRHRGKDTQYHIDEKSWVDERAHPTFLHRPRQTYGYAPSQDQSPGSRESQRRHRSRHHRTREPSPSETGTESSSKFFAKYQGRTTSRSRRPSGQWGSTGAGNAVGRSRSNSNVRGSTGARKERQKHDTWGCDDDNDSLTSEDTAKRSAHKAGRSRSMSQPNQGIEDIVNELKALKLELASAQNANTSKPSTSKPTSRRGSRGTNVKSTKGPKWGATKPKDDMKSDEKIRKMEAMIQILSEQLKDLRHDTTKSNQNDDSWDMSKGNDTWGNTEKVKEDDVKSTAGRVEDKANETNDDTSGDKGWGSGAVDVDNPWDNGDTNDDKKDDSDPWESGKADPDNFWGDSNKTSEMKEDSHPWGAGSGAGKDKTDDQKESGGDNNSAWGAQTDDANDKNDSWNTANDNDQAQESNDNGWGSKDKNQNNGGDQNKDNGCSGGEEKKDDSWDSGNKDQNNNSGWGNNDGDDKKSNSGGWGNNDEEDKKSNSGGCGNDTGNIENTGGWDDEKGSKKTASQVGDGWNTGHNDKKSSSRKSDTNSSHKSSHHTSHGKSSSHQAPPSTSPRAYWSTWNTNKHPTRDEFSSSSDLSSRGSKSKKVYLEPEEPLLIIPSSHADKEFLDHQIRAGKGSEYHHRVGRPEYMDSLEKPYAVFRFKYRSRDALKRILGKDVLNDGLEELLVASYDEGDVRDKLLDMSKEEIVEAMLKLRSNSGVSKSNDKRSERSGKKSEHTHGHRSNHKSSNSHHSNSGSKKAGSILGGWNNDDNNDTAGNGGGGWDSGVQADTGVSWGSRKGSSKGSGKKDDNNGGWGSGSAKNNDANDKWGGESGAAADIAW